MTRGVVDIPVSFNAREVDGNTALMLAVKNDHPDMVRHLCECGADILVKNNAGKTAEDLADAGPIVSLLQSVREQALLAGVGRPATPAVTPSRSLSPVRARRL